MLNIVAEPLSHFTQLKIITNGSGVNPLQPNISKHFLHTVLYTFARVPKRRNYVTVKSLLSW